MKKDRPLVLMWHNIYADSTPAEYLNGSNPTASLFKEQLRFIVSRRTPISIFEFMRIIEGESPHRSYTKPPVLFTFDDGFKNVIDEALPILEEFEAPAVFFVIGELLKNPSFVPWFTEVEHLLRRTTKKTVVYSKVVVDLTSPDSRRTIVRLFESSFRACKSDSERQECLDQLANRLGVARPLQADLDEDQRYVTREDLAKIRSPFLAVGSHTMTHRHLADLTEEEQAYELGQSHSLLEKNCPSYYPAVAYPGGFFNNSTIAIAHGIYKAAFAVMLGSSYRNLYAYPRIGIGHDSVSEIAYATSPRRLNYILPVKRAMQAAGLYRE